MSLGALRRALAALFASGVCAAAPAHALSCVGSNFRELPDIVRARWTQSAVVFVGKLSSLAASPEGVLVQAGPWSFGNQVATFEVETSFKEPLSGVIAVRTDKGLTVGERYVVFAHQDPEHRTLWTNAPCILGPQKPVSLADPEGREIVAALHALPPVGAGGAVQLGVTGDFLGDEGVVVRLRHFPGERIVRLERMGRARVDGLAAGYYRLDFPGSDAAIRCFRPRPCDPFVVPDRGLVEVSIAAPPGVSSLQSPPAKP